MRFKAFLNEITVPRKNKEVFLTLQKLKKSNLLTGPVVGGAAFGLLTGKWDDVDDVDIYGKPPSDNLIDKAGMDRGFLTFFYQPIKDKPIIRIEYIKGQGDFIKAPISTVKIGNILIASKEALIHTYETYNKHPKRVKTLKKL